MGCPTVSKNAGRALRCAFQLHAPQLRRGRIIPALSAGFQTSAQKKTSTKQSPLSRPLPKGTWDSHMHVVDPVRFPLDANASYKPDPHTLEDANSFYPQFGIENYVFVQPSIYGNDNSCMLEAVRELTQKHTRAVVGCDPLTVGQDTLKSWHADGVRGVRVNLVSVGREVTESELKEELQRYVDIIRPYGWVLQLYIPLKLAIPLERIVPDLKVKVCIDHFGSIVLPKPYDPSKPINPYDYPGFASLVNLLKAGSTWVKLSGQYRLARDPMMRDLDPVGRELVQQAPSRLVYATDWPHTRFDKIDSAPFIEMCYEWCDQDETLIEKLFRTNAEELWDVASTSQ